MLNPPIEKTGTLPLALSRTESGAVKSLTRAAASAILRSGESIPSLVRLTRAVPVALLCPRPRST